MVNAIELDVIVYVVIGRGHESKLLMCSGAEGYFLPSVTPNQNAFNFIGGLTEAVKVRYGISATLLQVLTNFIHPDTKTRVIICALENQNSECVPHHECHWVDYKDIRHLVLADPTQQIIIDSWFHKIEERKGYSQCAPWQCKGFFNDIMSWITESLAPLKIYPTESFRQISLTNAHCLFEVSTTEGKFYFKAVREHLTHEQELTRFLAQKYQLHLPRVAAVDAERHWWLMWDVGGEPLDQVHDPVCWGNALKTFANIQIDNIKQTGNLRAIGTPDWGLEKISANVDRYFIDLTEIISQQPKKSELEATPNYNVIIKRLKELCDKLAGYGIPTSLGHGDFNCGNIQIVDGKCVFIDWAEGYVGHPLFTMFDAINYFGIKRPELKGMRSSWRYAYLDPWTSYFHIDHLTRAYSLARPLALLRRIMRGLDYILAPERSLEEKMNGINIIDYLFQLMIKAAYSSKISE
jgi:phosphotransferase family enzyme